nr:hypothetical protein [Deltaproteobacteria bacterium]
MSIARFTPKPRRVTATGPCTLEETLEFRGYRSVRLTLRVLGFEGATAPMLWVAMETSLHPDRDYGSLGRFCPVARDGVVEVLNCDYLMRYVRWNVVRLDGADAAWFTLDGAAGE